MHFQVEFPVDFFCLRIRIQSVMRAKYLELFKSYQRYLFRSKKFWIYNRLTYSFNPFFSLFCKVGCNFFPGRNTVMDMRNVKKCQDLIRRYFIFTHFMKKQPAALPDPAFRACSQCGQLRCMNILPFFSPGWIMNICSRQRYLCHKKGQRVMEQVDLFPCFFIVLLSDPVCIFKT